MRLNNKIKIILIIFIGVIVVVFLNFYQGQTRNFFYSISLPIQKSFWSLGQRAANFFQAIVFSHKIQEENKELHLLTQELLAKIAKFSELERENRALREALAIGLQEEFELLLGQVTAKDIFGDYLIINKGAKDGIKDNLPVITQQKVLVGSIDQVYENFATVELVSNKKSSFEGRILGRNVQGLVKGEGNSKALFDLVPQQEEVKEGELVITAALSNDFPAGLLVGQVKIVKKSDVEPFQQIEIEPAFNIGELNYLFIIR